MTSCLARSSKVSAAVSSGRSALRSVGDAPVAPGRSLNLPASVPFSRSMCAPNCGDSTGRNFKVMWKCSQAGGHRLAAELAGVIEVQDLRPAPERQRCGEAHRPQCLILSRHAVDHAKGCGHRTGIVEAEVPAPNDPRVEVDRERQPSAARSRSGGPPRGSRGRPSSDRPGRCRAGRRPSAPRRDAPPDAWRPCALVACQPRPNPGPPRRVDEASRRRQRNPAFVSRAFTVSMNFATRCCRRVRRISVSVSAMIFSAPATSRVPLRPPGRVGGGSSL